MILAVDVHYGEDTVVAGVELATWDGPVAGEHVLRLGPAAPYVPGDFWAREGPPILALLATLPRPDVVVVDGYAWLGPERPGLGARLFMATGIPVVGVAKTSFRGAPAVAVHRGGSRRALYVTAAGYPLEEAVDGVARMLGERRIPDALRRVDALARWPTASERRSSPCRATAARRCRRR